MNKNKGKPYLYIPILKVLLLLFSVQFVDADSLKNHFIIPETARWLPEKGKLVCLVIQGEKASDGILILDVGSKTYKFCQLTNTNVALGLTSLPFIKNTEEIVLPTYNKDGCKTIRINPFVENAEIKTIYRVDENIAKKYDIYGERDIKVQGNSLLINFSKLNDHSSKYYTLLAFDIKNKEFSLICSDVRSSNLYQTKSGNVYFLSENGLQKLTKDSTELETVISSKNIESVTGKWGWEHCDVNSVYISPDEKIGILCLGVYPGVDLQKHSGKEFYMACSFDLTSRACLGIVSDEEHGIFYTTSIHFTPDSKRIFLYAHKKNEQTIEIYDASLKKSSTLFENSGSIMSCGKKGFIRIDRPKKENKSTEESPYDFLMYTWDGELLFKFKPSEQIKRADDELLADKAIPEDTSAMLQDNVVTEKKEDHAGEINYLLVDRKKNKTISEGKIIIHKEDISVKKYKSEGEEFFDKEVLIADPFSIGINIHKEKPEEMGGFGLYLKNKSLRSFSAVGIGLLLRKQEKQPSCRALVQLSSRYTSQMVWWK